MKREVVDSQSTQYWFKKLKNDSLLVDYNLASIQAEASKSTAPNCPLPILFSGKEPIEHVNLRYKLLQNSWSSQQQKIEAILQNANVDLFNKLIDFIVHNNKHYLNEASISTNRSKFEVGFLQLGSNIANNLRIFKDFQQYLMELSSENGLNFKIVSLSSRTCANVKATIREIVKQVTTDYSPDDDEVDGGEEVEEDDDEPEEEDDDESKKYHGKIAYDFDIISDWCQEQFAKEGSNINTTNLRIVVIVQDSDALPNQLLNQVLKLVYSYSKEIPLNLIVGLSSINSNISSWLNNNLSNELRIRVRGNLFRTAENKTLGHSICNDLFLQNNHDTSDKLLLSPELISIILNRFQNSNNSIDSLVASFKLAYMIHFYQLPLVVLLSKEYNTQYTDLYVDALRKLPSFKRHIESKIESFEYGKNKEEIGSEIEKLLLSSSSVIEIFHDSVSKSSLEKFKLINTMNILYSLQNEDFSSYKEKIEIYQLLVTRQIFSSLYLTKLCNSIKSVPSEQIAYIIGLSHILSEGDDDTSLLKFQRNMQQQQILSAENFVKHLKNYLKTYLNNQQLPLYEVFTILGGSIHTSQVELLEEKSKNLIINLLRPELRQTLEGGLDDSRIYLNNVLIEKEIGITNTTSTQPVITKLFRVYKDAPVNINIFDFYTAFRESFDKKKDLTHILENIEKYKCVDEEEFLTMKQDIQLILDGNDSKDSIWNKMLFAWFLQGCFEFLQMGIVKEKPKGDYLEKALWKGV